MSHAEPNTDRHQHRHAASAWSLGVTAALILASSAPSTRAADGALSSIAEREVLRREALVRQSGARLDEADAALTAQNSGEAAQMYFEVYQSLPNAAMAERWRDRARAGFAAASCHWAQTLMAEARYAEADQALAAVLAANVDPTNEEAKKLRKRFADADRYPPALTPQHVENVKRVTDLLVFASSALELGDFAKARKTYEDVLRIDATNVAARRGIERVEQNIIRYQAAARDHTRAAMINGVDKLWEEPVPPSVGDLAALFGAALDSRGNARGSREEIIEKLRTTIIPKVDFNGSTLGEVFEYLRVRSRDLDPKGRGVDFVVNIPADQQDKPVTLSLQEVPLEEVLRYVTDMTGSAFRVEDRAVTIVSLTEKTSQVLTKSYRVPPNFIQTQAFGDQGAAGAAAPADPFAAQQPAAGGALAIKRMGAKEFLESRGVVFKEGSMASYTAASNLLIVRNTPDNIAIVDMLVEQAGQSSPKQVVISVKMVEVNNKSFQELGVDWGLGEANLPGSEKVFFTGGTPNSALNGNIGPNSITDGVRGSGAILGIPSIDSLLVNNNVPAVNSTSPTALQLFGVFTDPQFTTALKAISQTKGTDLLSRPSVVTRSGQKAIVNISREFPYPTEFDPPEIPQNFSPTITTAFSAAGTSSSAGNFTVPVTPTTPTTFEYKDVGTVMEVEPVISEDGRSVEVNISASDTIFEGFIDYGTDFTNFSNSSSFDPVSFSFNDTQTTFAVDNPILQPVFRHNKVVTAVTIWDGATIVLGGLIGEKTTDINDKVPILGDIPFLGRLWQTKMKQVEKKNVIFFVTVKVIDPSGQAINQTAGQAAAR